MTNIKDNPDWWDPFSCQPYKLDKSEKPRASLVNAMEYGKVAITALGLSPIIAAKFFALKKQKPKKLQEMAGLSINIDPQWRSEQIEMVQETGVKNLLIRIPGWHLQHLDEYSHYISRFSHCEFIINILQSRDSILNQGQWEYQLKTIFQHFSPLCQTFKIGNAINRSKWGCRNSADALTLFTIADRVRKEHCPDIRLLGSSVIDFEPLITLRTLFNFADYTFDGCASLMYINRRGSAYGRQYHYFDLEKKLRLTKAILQASNNTSDHLWITETNWPLLNTKPYTPNSGNPRSTVDEQTQAEYLKQYFTIAAQTGWVERVYWWQLINPGYGLVDHRGMTPRKMPSYFAFKSLFNNLDE